MIMMSKKFSTNYIFCIFDVQIANKVSIGNNLRDLSFLYPTSAPFLSGSDYSISTSQILFILD